jgi:hypothetical protein
MDPGHLFRRNPVAATLRRLRMGEPVVIVSGLPRSGTSMVMKMLQAGGIEPLTDRERRADVDNPDGYFEYERVKGLATDPDRTWIREARGKSLKVISHLLQELPDGNFYRIIFAQRDLQEIVASQNIMLRHRGQAPGVSDAEAIDLYGRHLLRTLMHVRGKANMELLTLQYRDIVRDSRACSDRINRFLGGRLDSAAMAGAVNPALYRNRSPSPLGTAGMAEGSRQ